MSYINKLFSHKKIHNLAETDSLFFSAVKENLLWHMSNCESYKKILCNSSFSVESLNSIEDIHRIPPIPTLYLKQNNMLSVNKDKMIIKATSSGTSGGEKSLVGIDYKTGWNAFKMCVSVFRYYKIFSIHPTNYLILGYKPDKNVQMSAAKTAFGITLTTPTIKRVYAIENVNGQYDFNVDNLLDKLINLSKSSLPIRFMGFPAYLHFLLEYMKENNVKLKFHPKSMVFTAGGWKQFFSEEQDKEPLYNSVEQVLGISKSNCKDFFGAVEHPILYCTCKNNNFHLPIYSRAIIRDVKTLKPLKYGEVGLLNLITPLMNSMPFTSIITDDLAIMHKPEHCGCGISSPYIEILGRAGMESIKTCAVNAADLLKVGI